MTSERTLGRFITFEGVDGCGKTTQSSLLVETLRTSGIDVISTREPGGTRIGEMIRNILLDSQTCGLLPLTELLLMCAARAQHIEETIRPALKSGKWVLCDRFMDSSEAYQGEGRKLGCEVVLRLHEIVCGGLKPDLTVVIDADVETCVNRARNRNANDRGPGARDESRFEHEDRDFFERIRRSYLAIAKRESERVLLIDASDTVEGIHSRIATTVCGRFLQPMPRDRFSRTSQEFSVDLIGK